MRVYEAVVPESAPTQRLENYVRAAFPLLPASVIRKAFAARDVKMDGVCAGRDAMTEPGAQVRLYTAYTPELPVVYEDDRILLVNKPAGISVDDDGRGGMTVLSLLTERAAGQYIPRLCHRLDNPTCGLLLLAKDDESEQTLLSAFRERRLEKKYECLVRGQMRPESATAEAFLIKDAANARVRIVTHAVPGAAPIATRYETLDFDGTVSRLRVTLLTGRTHQIRAHLAFLSHPVLGDDKYGDRTFNRRMKSGGLKLCACSLTLHAGGCLSDLDGRTFSVHPPF